LARYVRGGVRGRGGQAPAGSRLEQGRSCRRASGASWTCCGRGGRRRTRASREPRRRHPCAAEAQAAPPADPPPLPWPQLPTKSLSAARLDGLLYAIRQPCLWCAAEDNGCGAVRDRVAVATSSTHGILRISARSLMIYQIHIPAGSVSFSPSFRRRIP
jgi:hypothetical protein